MGLVVDDLPSTDPSPLEWWAGQVIAGKRVRSWLPDVFERYARILHPAYVREETPQGIVHRLVTWSELARWSGKPLTTETCIDDLFLRSDGLSWSERGAPPTQGRLDPQCLRRLVNILAPAPDTAEDVWFLVWGGLGRGLLGYIPRGYAEIEVNPSWRGTGRTYLLFHGALFASAEKDEGNQHGVPIRPMPKPPSFWWPMDRRWFVSTDIESYSTYVGGSATLVDRLLEDDVLEAVAVSLDDLYDPCVGEGNEDREEQAPGS